MPDTETAKQFYSATLSSTDLIKKNLVELLFQCTVHKSKSFNNEEKYSFCAKVEDLSVYLLRYTPETNQKELADWNRQLKNDITKIMSKKEPGPDLNEEALQTRYKYALEVHQHNARILFNSPIIELEMEGEINPSELNKDIDVVRNTERRTDDPIIAKF